MKILYAGQLSPHDSATYRQWALERLGHTVIPFNVAAYEPGHDLLRKIAFRLSAGTHLVRLNRDLLATATREHVDLFWSDKVLGLWPSTLQAMRRGNVTSVSYMIDNAFGPRRDPGWRLYLRCLREFDLHVTQRDVSVEDLLARGARDVLKIQTAFEPTVHFPPRAGWGDADRNRGVSFIGTAYDDRAATLTRLWREGGFSVSVNGNSAWQRALDPAAFTALANDHGGNELYLEQYREAIWRSRINLSFLTHSNQDEFVHKSFEIAACKGFLLAERSPGHLARFIEDEEAVFFSSYEECAAKIQRYLTDETSRDRIAAAGWRRALASGYDNDTQVGLILQRVEDMRRGTNSQHSSSRTVSDA